MNESVPLSPSKLSGHRSSPQRQEQRQKTISCMICHAVYAPAPSQGQLLNAAPQLLESVFMGMCHFCFRCRRPSCPSCWDEVHGICGACVLETGLPFRTDAPPLHGTWLPPIRHTRAVGVHPASSPLICIQPGSLDRPATLPMTERPSVSTDPVRAVQSPPMHPVSPPPPIPSTPLPLAQQPLSAQPQTPGLAMPMNLPGLKPWDQPILLYADDEEDEMAIKTDKMRVVRITQRVERALTALLLITIALVLVMIIAASFSATANSFIDRILHVDVRAEITYLWQFIVHAISTLKR
jgi:hypothetical protein